ncbi:MAG: hypothetical protein U1F25_00760 [Rubrivivax sp.]
MNPFMADVAARCTHMGPVGAGLVAKMLNQLIVGCVHAVMAEAASMAEAAGIDAAPARVPGRRPRRRHCCSASIRAWWRATSRRRATRASCARTWRW